MIARRLLLINVLVLLGIVALSWVLVSGWQEFEAGQNVRMMVGRVSKGSTATESETETPAESETLFHDFFIIADRNLFSPERRPEPDEDDEADAVEEAPEFPKRPEMNGAATLGGDIRAFLTIFESSKAQGSSMTVGLGDVVQGYAVHQITDSTVTLKWNDTIEVIDMMDASTPQQRSGRAAANTAAVNIIRIGARMAAVEATSSEDVAEDARGQAPGAPPAAGPRGRVTRGRTGGIQPQSRLGRSGRPIPNRAIETPAAAVAATGAVIPQMDVPQER